ncbi:MAG: hypothetical protein WKG07_35045 [Hymenobacter sp.]
MQVHLTDGERRALRQLQKQRRDDDGYVKVTVVLMLDSGWPVGQRGRGARAWTRPRSTATCGPLPTWGWTSTWPTSAPATGAC